uniref:RINT1-like protein MAG2L n=2 Tax=Kalanchoe fedtschenkoi TaxID=63787 RepID=A0A7N1A9J5_KALFE
MIEDFLQFTKEIHRIDAIREYVGTTLRLEALVGDLEDVIFSIMSQQGGNMFSAGITAPRSGDSQAGHEILLQAVKVMHGIEEVLAPTIKSHPHWSHLLRSVDSRVDKILTTLRPKVIADHRSLLASLGWPPNMLTGRVEEGEIAAIPNPLLLMQPDKREAYSRSFLGLCALQHLHSLREVRKLDCLGQKDTYRVLWAIDELVSPIASRTEYHFSKWAGGEPKYVFALVYRITRDFIVGIDDVLQPLIDQARLASCSATEAWVFAMVQMLDGFLNKSVFPPLADKCKVEGLKQEAISMWIHLIDLMVAFDKQMLSLLSSEPGRLEGVSRGISVLSVFAIRSEWLKLWAKIELKDAWKKLKAELNDEKCWLNSNDNLSTIRQPVQQLVYTWQDFRVPSIAEFAAKIAWEMIERGQNLPHIPLQAQFIRMTAGRFFWYFFKVLIFRCKRHESDVAGLGDVTLSRICESMNAARFIESKLLEWSDDVAFVEMVSVESHLDAVLLDNFDDETIFFSEELKSIAELQTNGLMEIITDVLCQFEHLSWDYIHNKESHDHAEVSHERAGISTDPGLSLSHTLIQALDFVRDRLLTLKARLNPSNFLDLWKGIADGLDHFILNSILEIGTRFSMSGMNQFHIDMKAVFLVFQPFCERPEAFLPRIRYALQLLQTDIAEAGSLLCGSHQTEYSQGYAIPYVSREQVEKIMNMKKF